MVNDLQDISLDQIYDFIENRDTTAEGAKSSPVMVYMLEMEKVRGMALRIDRFASKDAIVNHLMKVDKYSRYFASKLYNQAMEYFYCDNEVSKTAWRNIYAEKMEKVINFAIATMKDASDASKVSKMIADLGKLRGLDQPDPEEFPDGMFDRPFKIYSTDPEFLGMPKIDRRKLSDFIDGLPEMSDAEKIAIKREAQILPVKFLLPDDENPRKA